MRFLIANIVASIVLAITPSSAMAGWKTPEIYSGIALLGERMNLVRTEGIWDNFENAVNAHDPQWVAMSHGQKTATHGLTGHAFVGALWALPRSPFFMGPELMGGLGTVSDRLHKVRYIAWSDTDKSFDATLQRRMSWSAVVRFGITLPQEYRIYALGGVSREQFRYTINYHYSSDSVIPIPAQFIRQTRWSTGAVWGLGIEKKIQNFRVGLEGRVTHSRIMKFHGQFGPETALTPLGVNSFEEKLRSQIRSRTSSILIKMSYAL